MRVLLLSCLILLLGTAAPPPNDNAFGIVYVGPPSDATQVEHDFDAFEHLGVSWVRILPDWTVQAPSPGPMDWRWSDTLIKAARTHHLQVVYTLGYMPRWASQYAAEDDPEAWNHNNPRDFSVWQDYVTAVSRRYAHDVSVWQVWERSDIHHYRGTNRDLATLLAATRASLPGARLVAPETGSINLGSLRLLYRDAGLFDIVGLYPDQPVPEAEVRPLDTLKARIGPSRTEWLDGLGSNGAASLVRSSVLALAHGADKVFWDYSPDLESTCRPLISHLQGTTFQEDFDWGHGRYALLFTGSNTAVLVAWTDGEPVDLPGGQRLSSSPVYLTGTQAELESLKTVSLPPVSAPPDYSQAADVRVDLSEHPQERGLYVHRYPPLQSVSQGGWSTDLSHQRTEMLFDIDDTYLYYVDGRYDVAIDVEAWGNPDPRPVGFNIGYDGEKGYSFTPWQWVDAEPGWKHYLFHLHDAVLADPYCDFRINALGSKGDLVVRSVRVSKEPRPQ